MNIFFLKIVSPVCSALLDLYGSDVRPMIVTRATVPGDGRWSGRWLGDNSSGWKDLELSIIGS